VLQFISSLLVQSFSTLLCFHVRSEFLLHTNTKPSEKLYLCIIPFLLPIINNMCEGTMLSNNPLLVLQLYFVLPHRLCTRLSNEIFQAIRMTWRGFVRK
jgi:hypothetical protein